MLFVRVAEGMLKTFAIEQSKNLDELSNSTGSCDGITRRCTNCDGTGMETSIRRNGPFIQQTRRESLVCHGSRDMVDPENRGRKCYGKKVIREEKAREEERAKKYRDRARERREISTADDQLDISVTVNQQTTSAGNYKSVAPDIKGNFDAAARRKQQIDESKFLGGDLEHTHLVKGLDYALLQKV